MRAITVAKLGVAVPVIVLTSLAYSSLFPERSYIVAVALAILLLGILTSTGSVGRVVFLSMVLYTVPFTIGASQFLPVAFPDAYRRIGELVLQSPYFSDVRIVFLLVGLGILTEYVEVAEEWEEVLRGLGREGVGTRTLLYSVPAVIGALGMALALLTLTELIGIGLAGMALPVLLLAVGLGIAYGLSEAGSYRRVLVAVELSPQVKGEVEIIGRKERVTLPIEPSASFEWDTIRLEAELRRRPLKVVLRRGEREHRLSPLVEGIDGKTLFLLYRVEE